MNGPNSKNKIFAAISGGVDSSVAALMLKKGGYDVTGVYIKSWDKGCEWKEDRRDAMSVCAKLSIPFLTFDFEKEYKKEVIDYMTREYISGRTPNPDVMCNKKIKFGFFLNKALKMGADCIATGHYIKIQKSKCKMQNDNAKCKIIYKLFKAKDKNKDQSYFLWTLTQEQLRHCLFPIGDHLKTEVREMARKARLITADKKDSQGLCFVGKVKFNDFLKNLITEKKVSKNQFKKGSIVGTDENILGEHKGLVFYTIGQRQGLEIGGRKLEERQESRPLYVIEKDYKKNILIVGEENNPLLYKKELFAENLSWTVPENKIIGEEITARIRYRQPLQKCKIYTEKNGIIKVVFDAPQRAVAPGQSIVFYKGEEMLGGGIIKN